jgi:predicted AAA+ superfamily ATPase
MIHRRISEIAFSPEFRRQMRFIAGPRQAGKTTLAREFLRSNKGDELYYNWDNRKVRERYFEDNHFFLQDIHNIRAATGKRWVCFDEIHKYPKWKNVLKDFFDSFGEDLGIIVTGSARLDLFRKSGDSLAGRYFLFHVYPFSLAEALGRSGMTEPPAKPLDLIRRKLDTVEYHEDVLGSLLEFGGFPEPFLAASPRFHARWQADYVDRVIREDLRDLTHVRELENIAVAMKLLPERIGSPLSINSLAEDLHVNHGTMAGYLRLMELGYIIFRIRPYAKKLARSLTKETKAYFYDWTRAANAAACFENWVAVELRALADLWTDGGFGTFELCYVRTRDGKETDFLMLRDDKPWVLFEAKSARSDIEFHHLKNRDFFGAGVPFVQLVRQDRVAEKVRPLVFQMSASRFFS